MGILSLVMVTQALVIGILTLVICIETLMMGTKTLVIHVGILTLVIGTLTLIIRKLTLVVLRPCWYEHWLWVCVYIFWWRIYSDPCDIYRLTNPVYWHTDPGDGYIDYSYWYITPGDGHTDPGYTYMNLVICLKTLVIRTMVTTLLLTSQKLNRSCTVGDRPSNVRDLVCIIKIGLLIPYVIVRFFFFVRFVTF